MDWNKCFVLICCFFQLVVTDEPPCVIELSCRECVPDNMPLVTSHRAANGSVVAASGDELRLSCGAGRLLAYPLLAAVAPRCEAGRYRVPGDARLRHLLDLGCQESVFEDVLHEVEHCGPPRQGRVYRLQDENQKIRHLAAVCLDEDSGVATFARASNAPGNALRTPPHSDRSAPLTLFGNLNSMFDSNTRSAAEKLYSDDVRMNRRLRELFKHERFSFAGQTLTARALLGGLYFEDQNVRVSDFASNKVAVWSGVASGNLEHLQRDVAELMRQSRPRAELDVYAGTHGTLALRAGGAGGAGAPVRLRAGRFPVPRYVWTLVHDRVGKRALAVAVLNDPFVAVSEVREAAPCESQCGRVSWLRALRRHRNYEAPVYGLAFCCSAHELAAVVPELPAALLADVTPGSEGLLGDMYMV